LRLEVFDEDFEREILVSKGSNGDVSDFFEEVGERSGRGETSADNESVNEEADEGFDFSAIAAGDRRADDDVELRRVPEEKYVEGGEKSHKESGIEGMRDRAESRRGREIEMKRMKGAGIGLDERTRAISGQLEEWEAGELRFPVGELGIEEVALEPVALPDGEVGVLNRQIREGRRASSNVGSIQSRQLTEKDPH